MKNLFVAWLVFSLSGALSMADVVSENSELEAYVKVTRYENETFSFWYCETRDSENCTVLGRQKGYSINELKNARKAFQSRGNRKLFADVLLAAALIGGGFAGGGRLAAHIAHKYPTLGLNFLKTIFVGASAGALVGGAAELAVVSTVDFLNPRIDYRKAKTLSEEVLDDNELEVDGIAEFSSRLDEVLRTIE